MKGNSTKDNLIKAGKVATPNLDVYFARLRETASKLPSESHVLTNKEIISQVKNSGFKDPLPKSLFKP